MVVIPAVEIVSGAFIEHEAGDLAPTDARLLEASSLKSVEAELTGKSETVSERAVTLDQDDAPLGNRRNMVFVNYRQINRLSRAFGARDVAAPARTSGRTAIPNQSRSASRRVFRVLAASRRR